MAGYFLWRVAQVPSVKLGAPGPDFRTWESANFLRASSESSLHAMAYDAEGNILKVDNNGATATYVYNALNQRVQTVANGATTGFLFDASGERVSEWNAAPAQAVQLEGNYYWQGKPLAYYTTAADTGAAVGTHFEHLDYMGTERLRTNYNSANNPTYAIEASFADQPFGDNKKTFGADTDANHYAFLDTDKETATDHADFRQYSNAQGRWMAPDPYDGSYSLGNPQSLNRYVYAANSPLSAIDLNGLWCVWGDGTHDDDPGPNGEDGGATPQQCKDQGGYWDPTDTVIGCNDATGICKTAMGNVGVLCGGGWGDCTDPNALLDGLTYFFGPNIGAPDYLLATQVKDAQCAQQASAAANPSYAQAKATAPSLLNFTSVVSAAAVGGYKAGGPLGAVWAGGTTALGLLGEPLVNAVGGTLVQSNYMLGCSQNAQGMVSNGGYSF